MRKRGYHLFWSLAPETRASSMTPVKAWCRYISSLRGAAKLWNSVAVPVEPRTEKELSERFVFDSSRLDSRSKTMGDAWWLEEGLPPAKNFRPCRMAGYERDWQVGTWNSVCEDGQLHEVVEALDILVQQGSYVDNFVFYRLLKRCMAQTDLLLGRRVQALAVESGYEADTFLANHIICMYGSHGRLQEAMQVFTKVAEPNRYMWASIILAHARHGQPTDAIQLYRKMRASSVKPDNHIFVAILKACATARDLSSGKEVHADVLGFADELNVFVGNCLVDMYAKCGSLEDARKVFDKLLVKNVVTWTAMIAGYAQHGLGQEALALYASMQLEGISPNIVTFVCLLQTCGRMGAIDQGKQLHTQIQERGLEANVGVGNALVDMYVKFGTLLDALRVFEMLPTRDDVTWATMIVGCAEHGLGQEALALYARMQQEGLTLAAHPTVVCLLLKAFAAIRAWHEGTQLHSLVQERGLESDVVVGSCLVDMYAKFGMLEDARRVFDRLPTKNVVTWTAMIAGYAHHGLSQEALSLHATVQQSGVSPDAATWNAMLAGYAQHGMGQEALTLYASMQQQGLVPANRVTYLCLLKACASVGALHQGKQLHSQIRERGLDVDVAICNSLVDMYSKCGNLEDARKVLDNLPTRDIVTWNAMINGYGQRSDGKNAIRCFEKMQLHGVEPDEVTFICLLVACSYAGMVTEGREYFRMMVEEHGILPSVDHHNCMVDLLGRSGVLDEAEQMMLTMRFDSNVVGWMSLLTACRSHGDIDRGKRCFNSLTKVDPQNAAAHVLMANIYADAGRWEDVYRMERNRRLAGVRKKAASACIEVKSKVHTFVVGDERDDISSKLRSVNVELKQGRHVAHTELVLKPISDSQKEDALCGHAEKLALAYGLLNTADGETLIVTKNLRMCSDCHSGTKIMSSIEKREIIVRDANRVHHFVNGSCSCGDRH